MDIKNLWIDDDEVSSLLRRVSVVSSGSGAKKIQLPGDVSATLESRDELFQEPLKQKVDGDAFQGEDAYIIAEFPVPVPQFKAECLPKADLSQLSEKLASLQKKMIESPPVAEPQEIEEKPLFDKGEKPSSGLKYAKPLGPPPIERCQRPVESTEVEDREIPELFCIPEFGADSSVEIDVDVPDPFVPPSSIRISDRLHALLRWILEMQISNQAFVADSHGFELAQMPTRVSSELISAAVLVASSLEKAQRQFDSEQTCHGVHMALSERTLSIVVAETGFGQHCLGIVVEEPLSQGAMSVVSDALVTALDTSA